MNTLLLATPEQEEEYSLKFRNRAFLHIQDPAELKAWLPQADIVFDLFLHEQPERLEQYNQQGKGDKLTVFIDANAIDLAGFAGAYAPLNFHLVGLRGAPLFDRETIEVRILSDASKRAVDKSFVFLASLYKLV
ncbi:hypothetical protein [Sabulibacter ruber]|uniref:hypothetical protein n=1 Tax=Sabulibacter ruber TaxID=2811901 RepID=UPI001A96C65D|nr:hypothetical protein [Sabulibacter ruber]